MKELIQRLAGLVYEANEVKDKYEFELETKQTHTEVNVTVTAKENHGYCKVSEAWFFSKDDENKANLQKGIDFLQEYLETHEMPEWVDDGIIETMKSIAKRNKYSLTDQDIAEIFDREVKI